MVFLILAEVIAGGPVALLHAILFRVWARRRKNSQWRK